VCPCLCVCACTVILQSGVKWSDASIDAAAYSFLYSCYGSKGSTGYILGLAPLFSTLACLCAVSSMFTCCPKSYMSTLARFLSLMAFAMILIGFWSALTPTPTPTPTNPYFTSACRAIYHCKSLFFGHCMEIWSVCSGAWRTFLTSWFLTAPFFHPKPPFSSHDQGHFVHHHLRRFRDRVHVVRGFEITTHFWKWHLL
jgi:hypothetical protein